MPMVAGTIGTGRSFPLEDDAVFGFVLEACAPHPTNVCVEIGACSEVDRLLVAVCRVEPIFRSGCHCDSAIAAVFEIDEAFDCSLGKIIDTRATFLTDGGAIRPIHTYVGGF